MGPDEARNLSQQRKRVHQVAADLPPLLASDLAREAAVSPAIIRAMAAAGQLQTTELPRAELVHAVSPERMAAARENLVLSEAQGKIAQGIAETGFEGFQAHLLDGVTGSGKTEVYFDLVARCVAASKQCLILLPEIALTRGWQERFEALVWVSARYLAFFGHASAPARSMAGSSVRPTSYRSRRALSLISALLRFRPYHCG